MSRRPRLCFCVAIMERRLRFHFLAIEEGVFPIPWGKGGGEGGLCLACLFFRVAFSPNYSCSFPLSCPLPSFPFTCLVLSIFSSALSLVWEFESGLLPTGVGKRALEGRVFCVLGMHSETYKRVGWQG